MSTGGLQPLPEAHLVAADLRRQASELLLMADRLEASVPLPPREVVTEFLFSKKPRPGARRPGKAKSKGDGK